MWEESAFVWAGSSECVGMCVWVGVLYTRECVWMCCGCVCMGMCVSAHERECACGLVVCVFACVCVLYTRRVVGVGRCLFAVCAMSFLNEKCVLSILNAYLLYESKMSLFGFHSCLISLI
jgi:hypothetical protein